MRQPHRFLVGAFVLLAAGALVAPAGAATRAPKSGELWVSRYDGASAFDEAKSVASSPDGTKVFVTGWSNGSSTGYDYATVAYSAATGTPLWVARYNGTGNGTDEAYAVAVSPDSSKVFVTGYSFGSTSSYDYATVAYNATSGTLLWVKRYNGVGNLDDYAKSIGVSPDGSKVFVTGYSYGGAIGYDYATVAYNAATGGSLWGKRFDGVDHGADYAYSLAVSPNGSRVFVTGYADMGATGNDYVTIAYATGTGATVWGKSYIGPGNSSDYGYSVAVSPDSSKVFVTGESYGGSSTGYDYATIGINATTGGSLWLRRYNGPGSSTDSGQSVVVSPDGSKVFVTGWSYGSTTSYDYATFAYNSSTGSTVWGQRYNGPGNSSDYAFAVGVTLDGSEVFATGYAYNGASGYDYASAGYDARTGGSLGARVYNGPANGSDYAFAMAVSSTIVFITGESYGGSATDYDYATAAYAI